MARKMSVAAKSGQLQVFGGLKQFQQRTLNDLPDRGGENADVQNYYDQANQAAMRFTNQNGRPLNQFGQSGEDVYNDMNRNDPLAKDISNNMS